MPERERIAVIGCGVAGLCAAHLLQKKYDVTVFERNNYIGGHTHTIPIAGGADAGIAVDTGFIVCNNHTYPLFHKLLDQLGVKVRNSDMSFSYHDEESGFYYSGTGINGLFAQRRNLLRPSFWRMLLDIRRFCTDGKRAVEAGNVPEVDVAEFLRRGGYSREFTEWYLLPMAAAIWSAPPAKTMDFPVASLLRFFLNHGLLSLKDRPVWQTVEGGSHSYVKAFERQFKGSIFKSCAVKSVRRSDSGVTISTPGGEIAFDRAVIAAHADEAMALLADPSPEERRMLGAWSYQENKVLLHTDASVLPPTRRAWASWNYLRTCSDDSSRPVSVSYYMNLLQGFAAARNYCVSLNLRRPVETGSAICELQYMHPVYDFASMGTQAGLPSLNGVRRTYFCGSYFGYGFHEDAVRSGAAVAGALGVDL